jgi:hypothetical protein
LARIHADARFIVRIWLNPMVILFAYYLVVCERHLDAVSSILRGTKLELVAVDEDRAFEELVEAVFMEFGELSLSDVVAWRILTHRP